MELKDCFRENFLVTELFDKPYTPDVLRFFMMVI